MSVPPEKLLAMLAEWQKRRAAPDASAAPVPASAFQEPLPPQTVAQTRAALDKYGITYDQQKAYSPYVSEAVYEDVSPWGYYGHTGQMLHAAVSALGGTPGRWNDRTKRIARTTALPELETGAGLPNAPAQRATLSDTWKPGTLDSRKQLNREDAWRLYNGLPQVSGTFGISDYAPSVSTEQKPYFKVKEFVQSLGPDAFKRILDTVSEHQERTGKGYINLDSGSGVMGNYKMGVGQDEHGPYLSYYDNWDLNAPGASAVGRPYEIYDRVYYDPVTKLPLEHQPAASAASPRPTKAQTILAALGLHQANKDRQR